MLFFLLFNDLIVFEIILIELKFVNDIKKIEVIFLVCFDNLVVLFKFCIVINLLDSNFVVIIELDWIVFCYGILVRKVKGVKINLISVWKFYWIVLLDIKFKILFIILFNKVIIVI